MGGGGSSNETGSTTYNWNPDMESYWRQALGQGNYLTGLGLNGTEGPAYEKYPGERIADIGDDHWNALQNIRNTVSSGSYDTNSARDQAYMTTRGDYLGQNPGSGKQNPWGNAEIQASQNQYAGENPYFKDQVKQGMGEITDAYKQGTAADTTRMFNLSGAFGGSAHQNAVANNEAGLGKSLNNYATGMFSDQYDRSAGLEEGYQGRNLQAQTTNKGLGGQWYQENMGRENQNWENERGRMLGAVGMGQQGQQMDFDRYSQLMGVGNVLRGRDQQYMDQGYQDWTDQRDYGWNQLGRMTGLLSQAQGGVNPSSFTTGQGQGQNPWGNALGTALAGYGMFKS